MMSETTEPEVLPNEEPGINSPKPAANKDDPKPAGSLTDVSNDNTIDDVGNGDSESQVKSNLENGTKDVTIKEDNNPPSVSSTSTAVRNGSKEVGSSISSQISGGSSSQQQFDDMSNDFTAKTSITSSYQPANSSSKPVELKHIHIGDPKVRSGLRFEVVTARVIETGGKKHVAYTIMMKRVGFEPQPAVIERRYSDFCFIYECILRSFHPSILGDFQFPKKVLLGNFKAEVISERTDAFHKFLNLIANCNNLLYSDYFYSFLSSEEHNEAVSHIKLARYSEAIPLLETIFNVREKLLTLANVHVVLVLCELVACLSAESVGRNIEAFSYALLAWRGFELVQGHPDVEPLRVSFLKLCSDLAADLGQDKKPYDRQLSELRYNGVRIQNAKPLLEIIRDRYIHRASHTSKIS